ncbi:MAG: FAD:protein FMN transferase [Stenotrophobium sp.]
MRSYSHPTTVERARPLLGTRVTIRVQALNPAEANAAIDAAFGAIENVHRLMSFQSPDSDLSRLNREALHGPVQIDAHTYHVLECAQQFAAASNGVFDINCAAQLVEWGLLPRVQENVADDNGGDWRDLALLAHYRVRFHRPLCIDLGGIAKGYAVDCAIAALQECGITNACVNAGGDLRLIGACTERVAIRACGHDDRAAAVLEIRDAAVASSNGHPLRRLHHGRWVGPHLHGTAREPVDTGITATVVAPDCMSADALTKIVLADPAVAAGLLPRYDALAYRHLAARGWQAIGDTPQPATAIDAACA